MFGLGITELLIILVIIILLLGVGRIATIGREITMRSLFIVRDYFASLRGMFFVTKQSHSATEIASQSALAMTDRIE